MHTQIVPTNRRKLARFGALATGALALLLGTAASAQSLTVLPVNIEMAPQQMATTLTVVNQGDTETSVQIRAFKWMQPDGNEELTPSDEVLVSPPIATIAPGATQIVRLVLRRAPQDREATYRILLDQIPPAAAPGTVRIALRLSIPVFAAPATRVAANVQFRAESKAGQTYLVAVNDGNRRETIREITLKSNDGGGLTTAASSSPYILAGATRRWPIGAPGRLPTAGETVHLTGRMDAGVIDQHVPVAAAP
ncbi:MAG: fimbria/pilus periplasmic chaperone [Polaromonas sp.]|uniref:fimbrial biogenesis chaperone n=1 Tax=Polaromonas sp. TaxID=1869339 RepID=UPI002487EBA0|nr:fimbria/pilus periplasmic chaperone [Polaromonas sp.]MDI1238537.1 fimbria/pilus periplasmic chaperone [Polaromonas sp.]